MTSPLTNDEILFLQRLDTMLISELMNYDDFLTVEEVKKLRLILKNSQGEEGQTDVH